MMHYVIFDLEATCWDQWSKAENETIEIGALLVNEHQEVVSEFARFVKPLRYPILSDFCKQLTSIDQNDIDHAAHFYEVVEDFKSWFGYPREDYILCSWGFYDRKQFESDCDVSSIDKEWLKNHISLKHQYRDIKQLRRAIGMKNALKDEGFELEGTHHRGIDDAKNITKIFLRYFNDWVY